MTYRPELGTYRPDFGRLRTVTGTVPVSAIEGPVLAHEHLQIDLRWPVRVPSDPRRWLDEERRVRKELADLQEEHGLSLVVDLTGIAVGRDANTLARMSAGSQVAVVAATGFLAEPFHPDFVRTADIDQIAQRLLAEIGYGLDGTSILPGVIGEVGTWGNAPTEAEERCLRAAARAGLESGLSVATHGQAGLAQLEILVGEGLPADRIAVGHQDLTEDVAVHRKIAESGAYVSFGMLARGARTADEDGRLGRVLELIEAGHADQVLLSGGVSRMGHLLDYGGTGYGYLFHTFLPALRAAGVDEATVRTILHDNPLRWLTGASA
jgi:predicted metal-dependent phosphotriesterase family hydrolase